MLRYAQVPIIKASLITNPPQLTIPTGKLDKLSIPSIVVHPPQDEVNETSAQRILLHDSLDLATVCVPRALEAASGAISEINAIAVARQDVASQITNADNPITFIDSQVSSLLNTLSKFNDVVANIASV